MKLAAFALSIVMIFAIAFAAYGSPPGSDNFQKASAAVSHSATSAEQSITVTADFREVARADLTRDMPEEIIEPKSERVNPSPLQRRFEFAPDLYSDWVSDIPTPPNETKFNGFANTRAREKV